MAAEQISLLGNTPNDDPRVVFFDLETLRSAADVGGWKNLAKMGMACGVVYDTKDKQYVVYDEKDVAQLIDHLARADLVVGFNHIRFDYGVLAGYSKFKFRYLPSFDILVDVERVLGHRLKLDSIASATLGESKSADGLQSLQWVKEGKMDLVRDYCKKDVEVTRNVFEFGADNGFFKYQTFDGPRQANVQWNVADLIARAKELASSR